MKDFVFGKIEKSLKDENELVVIDEKANLSIFDFLSDEVYEYILKGFLNKWDDSFNKSTTINEYKQSILNYIESIDSDLKKSISDNLITKTLILILEYLESIGQYGD